MSYGFPSLPRPCLSYLDEHRLEILLAGVHVPLEVLVDPLKDQPQLGVAMHAVLSNRPETRRRKREISWENKNRQAGHLHVRGFCGARPLPYI